MSDIQSAIAITPHGLSVDDICTEITEIRPKLCKDSTLWLWVRDTNSPMSGKSWRVALELQRRGWVLRSEIIPDSEYYEYIFMFANERFYYYDVDAIRIPYAPISPSKYLRPRGSSKYKSSDVYADGHSQDLNDKRLRYMNPKGQNKRNLWEGDIVSPMILASAPIDGKIVNVFKDSEVSRLIAEHKRIEVSCDRLSV